MLPMSYEQYAQVEALVLEMPYEQKIQLLCMIADNLKNTRIIETIDSQIKKPKRRFGILKGKIQMAPDFDETPSGFEEYM